MNLTDIIWVLRVFQFSAINIYHEGQGYSSVVGKHEVLSSTPVQTNKQNIIHEWIKSKKIVILLT